MEVQDKTKLNEAIRLHGPVVESMKLAGYGLLLDGETFYKLGDELDPYLGGTFSMRQAYEIHAVTQAAAERARVAGIRKQIEEIEDISQSRDITENPDGTLLCSHCTMQLETKDEDCACEIIYRKRKGRIDGLRAELNGPGEGKA